MSEAVAVVEAPIVEVAPLGSLESVAEYRARRDKGDTGEPVAAEKPASADVSVADGSTAGSPVEPDPASEAGKALAAKKGSLQSRIDALTAERRETERQAAAREAALRAELEAAKAGKPGEQAKQPTGEKPKAADFDNYEDFVEALADYKADQRVKGAQLAQQQADHQRATISAQARVEAAAKAAHADFDETIGAFVAGGHQFNPLTAEAILNHPLGAELAYTLAKDPALNARLNAAPSAYVAGIEIGRVLAGLEKPAAAAAPVAVPAVSKAPAPVKPVNGASTANGKTDPADMNSIAEWRKRRGEFGA